MVVGYYFFFTRVNLRGQPVRLQFYSSGQDERKPYEEKKKRILI